jgi:arsenate reductase
MVSLFLPLQAQIKQFEKEFILIPVERKKILKQISSFVEKKHVAGNPAELNFICTHNSRRSHIAQIWAQAAAYYYHVANCRCYSGGTESTAFNPRAVKAMRDAGFNINKIDDTENPQYEVSFAEDEKPLIAFSKVYSDPFNPPVGYAAIMTCSHADENCPLVIGAEIRISLPFNDPKDFDSTPQETEKYHERVLEIGREICYAFSNILH